MSTTNTPSPSPYEIDRTAPCEFSTEYDGSLVIRGIIVAQPSSEFTKQDIARIVAAVNNIDAIKLGAPIVAERAREITEAQVAAWFESQAAALRTRLSAPQATIGLNARIGVADHTYWCAHDESNCGTGSTMEMAITEVIGKRGEPAKRAAEKREQAAKLLAEADAIAPQTL